MRCTLALVAVASAIGTWYPPPGGGEENATDAPVSAREEISLALPAARNSVKSRLFEFTYDVTVTGLAKKKASVWVPVARSSDDQQVTPINSAITSGAERPVGKFKTEAQYGNTLFFAETEPDHDGKVNLKLSYRVLRREVKNGTGTTRQEIARTIAGFLQSDRLVPIDGKPLELLKGKDLPEQPVKKARVLYDLVNNHMKYDKSGKGWGRGDSVWACDSKSGNCTDFHSLFISLARAQKIPAKFEVGFAIPKERGQGPVAGYHCWAFFRDGTAWVPVDISEANKHPDMKEYYFGNLTEDRVAFTTGRDLTLEPKQRGNSVNFLIYPYVEVDGQQHDESKIDGKFSYKDIEK